MVRERKRCGHELADRALGLLQPALELYAADHGLPAPDVDGGTCPWFLLIARSTGEDDAGGPTLFVCALDDLVFWYNRCNSLARDGEYGSAQEAARNEKLYSTVEGYTEEWV